MLNLKTKFSKNFDKDLKWLVPLLAMLFVPLLLFLTSENKDSNQKSSLTVYAAEVLEDCAKVSYAPTCYEEEIPKLMDFISMEEAFEVTRLVQQQDTSYQYCHVLGHKLSARETAKDVSKWKEIVARAPTGICSNGAIHGAFQERFRKEYLQPHELDTIKSELDGVCEKRDNWNPTGLVKGTCYHALGHLAMYITNADAKLASGLCEEIANNPNGDYSQVCFDGVFMQLFQPLEPDDFALIKGKVPDKEDLDSFCSQFESPKMDSCWSESWPMSREALMTNPNYLVEFCSFSQASAQIDRCYLGLFYVLTAQFNFDSQKIQDYCQKLPEGRIGQCFANASSRMIETDSNNIGKSTSLCAVADSLGVGSTCYQELISYSTFNFHAGSEEFFTLCNSLPGVYKQDCLAQGG